MNFALLMLICLFACFLAAAAAILWKTDRHISEYERLLKEEHYEEHT